MRCRETIQKKKQKQQTYPEQVVLTSFWRVVFPLADGVWSGKNKQPVDVPNICCKQRKKNAPNLEVSDLMIL